DVPDPVDYLCRVENILVGHHLSLDACGPGAILANVETGLGVLLRTDPNNPDAVNVPSSWATMCDRFLDLCPPTISRRHALRDLEHLTMNIMRPFREFPAQFDKLRRYANIPDNDPDAFE
ncbi:hypothetical protein IWQ57_005861, partial [Coemansia nantahalensis]